jgi:hypothetical protein
MDILNQLFTFYPIQTGILANLLMAYLDPGSGSFLIQLLIGSLVAAGFLLKGYWSRIRKLFIKASPQTNDPTQRELEEPGSDELES